MKKRIINMLRVLAVIAILAMLSITALPIGMAQADVYTDEAVYLLSYSPFVYNGTTYDVPMWYNRDIGGYFGLQGFNTGWGLSGEEDIDCGLYSIGGEETNYVPIWYEHGDKTNIDSYLTEYNASCDAYAEGLFTFSGGVFSYQGDPSGWAVLDGEGEVGIPIDPPYLELYIGLPETGHRSIFIMPNMHPEEEYLPEVWLEFWSGMSMATGESGCEGWDAIWENQVFQLVIPYSYVESIYSEEESVIARLINGFNTSSLPDDADITDAYWRVVPYVYGNTNGSDVKIVAGGMINSSIIPVLVNGSEEMPTPPLNESEFYDIEFASFNTSDIPFPPQEEEGYNMNASVYLDLAMNEAGLAYINKDGNTVLTLREEDEVNHICPPEGGGISMLFWTETMMGYPYPISYFVVDWAGEGEGEPIIPTGPVSVMMTIQALIFTFGGILGIMALVLKPELASFTVRAGLLLGLTIITVVGVAMLESIIVTLTQ